MTLRISEQEVIDGLKLVGDNFPTLLGAPDPEKEEGHCAYSTPDGTAWCVIGRLIDLWGFKLPNPEETANMENVTTLFRRYFPHVVVEPRAMALMEKAQTLNDEIISKKVEVVTTKTIQTRRTMKEVVDLCVPAPKPYTTW